MQELTLLIIRAQQGDAVAYDQLVRRFQDMAVAYAFAALGNMNMADAEDAAQEAFVEAFGCLASLREPLAFSQWLRRIVWKQCDRILRRKQIASVSLNAAVEEPCLEAEPHQAVESQELALQARRAIAMLPEPERVVTVLFYMGEHSQRHISEFLGVPVPTVKRRLYTARQKLKKRMIETMQEDLNAQRPSRNSHFADRVKAFTGQFSQMIDEGKSIVYSLSVLAKEPHNQELQSVIAQVMQDVQDGDTLSGAMSQHPKIFAQTYVETIRQGEVNGNLQLVLRQLGAT